MMNSGPSLVLKLKLCNAFYNTMDKINYNELQF